MAALDPQNDLRQLLTIETHDELKAFREVDIDSLDHRELQHWAKWIAGIEQRLERVQAAIAAGRELLTADNLSPFYDYTKPGYETGEFGGYLATLTEK
jgi:hypothetical protein